MNPYQVFHSPCEFLRRCIHVILVRPSEPGNIGSTARAVENMGVLGKLVLVGAESPLPGDAFRLAKHARHRLESACFSPSLQEALESLGPQCLSVAATARVGSSHRPHPLWVQPAMQNAISHLKSETYKSLALVFGPEASGLTNDEVGLCDWVATIPSVQGYRSLNLAQAILVFAYEANQALLASPPKAPKPEKPSQKEKVIAHFLQLAEEVGFILPGDPYKMRPQLEKIFSQLPPHIEGARTLHGLIEQSIRSVRQGSIAYKGRFRQKAEKSPASGVDVT